MSSMIRTIIDINCDIGESFGNFSIGSDDKIFPYITSCSIACGFHAGDPWYIDQTIDKALTYGLRIGAHPSYPDLQGFGRRKMEIPPQELGAIIRYQVAALKGMIESKGGFLSYVKPHGALYNSIGEDEGEAHCVLQSVRSIDDRLAVMGLPNSAVSRMAAAMNVAFIPEGFADRRYGANGLLLSREHPQAIIDNIGEMEEQATSIVCKKEVPLVASGVKPINIDTLCLHGDHPKASEFAKRLASLFANA